MIDERHSMFFIQVNDGFAIAAGGKNVASLLEVASQLDIIVDFAVGDEHEAAILVVKGLPSGLQIDDAEPAHGEHDVRIGERPLAVRSAMREQCVDTLDLVDMCGSQRGA